MPDGFFSDMAEFYHMANKGRVYLFGDGEFRTNPIHGDDLAEACIDAIRNPANEIAIGGPETMTHNEIAKLAFQESGRKVKICHIPDWIRRVILWSMKRVCNSRSYGPTEFFLTVMAIDMIAPKNGSRTLQEFFRSLKNQGNKQNNIN